MGLVPAVLRVSDNRENSANLPKTLGEVVDSIIESLDEDSKKLLPSIPKDDLIDYHHSWGMGIRNAYGLWGKNPDLLADCGSVDMEADDASTIIMHAVWYKLRELPIDDARKANENLIEDQLRGFGADMVYRMNRNAGSSEEDTYRTRQTLFGITFEEYKDLSMRVDAADKAWKDSQSAS